MFQYFFRMFQYCFKKVANVFQVPRVFPECFKGVSSNLKEGFRVFKRSFMLNYTHRSYPSRRRACFLRLGLVLLSLAPQYFWLCTLQTMFSIILGQMSTQTFILPATRTKANTTFQFTARTYFWLAMLSLKILLLFLIFIKIDKFLENLDAFKK